MSEAAPVKPRMRRRTRALLAGSLAVPVLLGSAGLGLYWTLSQEAGTTWLLKQLPGLEIEAPQGALLGEFSARRLSYTLPGGSDRITVLGLQGRGMRIAWSSSPKLWGLVHIDQLRADSLSLAFAPSNDASKPPTNLLIPVGLAIDALAIDRINGSTLGEQPLLGLRAKLELSAERGALHRVQLQALQWQQLRLSGQARVKTEGAMDLEATLAVSALPSDTLPDWRGSLALQGPLKDLQAQAQLQAKGQSLQAQAQLQAFAPWPLTALKASAERLDLAALVPSLPKTALSGEAELASKGWSEPAQLRLRLSNDAAGRWDQQRLPVQRLLLDLQTRPDQWQSLQVRELDALLGSTAAPAGRLSAQGQVQIDPAHQGAGWTLNTRLTGLRPAALDARLAALRLDGTLALSGHRGGGSDRGDGDALKLDARLAGDWLATPQTPTPLKLNLLAELKGRQLKLEQAQLSSGASSLKASGEALLAPAGWRAEASAQLQDFDPRLLWAGAPGSPWSRGKHSLNAQIQAKLQQPGGQDKTWPLGQAQLQLQASQIAGVRLSGQLDYGRADDAAEASLQAALDIAENKLTAKASVPARSDTAVSSIASQLELKAPKLAALSPLLALALPDAQLGGAAQGQLSLQLSRSDKSPWQAQSTGRLEAQDLRLSGPLALSLAQGQTRWTADTRADAPLALTAELQRLNVAGQQASKLSLDLQGSWAEHRLKLGLLGQLAPTQAKGSTPIPAEASLALNGQLKPPGSSPLQTWLDGGTLDWRGRIAQLQLRPANRKQPAWFNASDLGLQAQANRASGITSAALAPGRAEVAGATLRWSLLQWLAARQAGEHADLRAEVEMEPLAVAPLLARWQPEFGWGGNLVMGGKLSVRTLPKLDVDLVLERAVGDLTVTEERGVQALGLTDLRLGLSARDGLWQFTEGLAGSNLGALGGAITVHADPRALWPAPDARLEGVLQANVANLGTWGGWLPAGWRLGGTLAAGLHLSGTFGAPQIVGEAQGSKISLRNPLQGVDVTEGAFGLSLNGSTATLNNLSARGGAGQLSAEGQAQLGEQPRAKLQLKAERFVLLNRIDRRLQASGQAQLDLGPQSLALDGRFTVDEGLFDFSRGDAPSLGDDVVVLRPEQAAAAAAVTPAGKASERKTRINLAIDLGRELKLRGRGLDSRLRGELKLSQAEGPLSLTGTVRTFGGTYDAYGQKLDIERGVISFVGPLDNPRLDVQAMRPDKNEDVRVGVTVSGTAQNPRIKLISEPELSDTDKLSWLLLGRGPDGLGRADTALLQRAALALLSGEGESSSGKLIKNLGLDELSVMQDENETARGTVVRLGKQLSRRWYVGYERGLNATTGSWQLIYRIAQRFTLRAQSGEDNALELIWQWKWE